MILAALAGLFAGGWLTLLAHRLPRILEREWRSHCQDSPGASPTVSQSALPDTCAYTLLRPGWQCPHCAAPVRGWHRLPVASWLGLRGRCARCRQPIDWRYPVAEALCAAGFAACAWRFGPSPMALCAMGLGAALLVLTWIDLETSLLPDAITLPLAWAGLLVNLDGALAPLPMAVAGAVVGYGFLWVLFHVFRLLTGREGMGYGDFKLLAALGAWFGLTALPWLLLVASLAGVAGAGVLRWVGRARRGQSLPFGPYLALAGLVALMMVGHPPGF